MSARRPRLLRAALLALLCCAALRATAQPTRIDVVTPIAPHMLTNRPLVIRNDSTVEIDLADDTPEDARVTADGNPMPNLAPGDRIRIARHTESVRQIGRAHV